MQLAVLSYSHHGRSIGRTARDLGHEIVGVMDGEENPRTQLENEFGCPGFDTAGACLDAVQPEAALISGKHIEIPSHIQACVDRRIPYLVDKPFADCASRLRPVAEATEKHDVFSALTPAQPCEQDCGPGQADGGRWQSRPISPLQQSA